MRFDTHVFITANNLSFNKINFCRNVFCIEGQYRKCCLQQHYTVNFQSFDDLPALANNNMI